MPNIKPKLLDYIEINPTSPANYTVIWLHGLGADGSDFISIVPYLNLPIDHRIRFLFPHAPFRPITINQGMKMRAWYDITGFELHSRQDATGIKESQDAIHQLIDNEISNGISAQHILLAGFSQGAAIALTAGLSYPHKLIGLIGLSGYLPPITPINELTTLANSATPIFLGHGVYDAIVPLSLGEATYKQLKAGKHPITWKNYPIEHTVSNEEIQDIAHWIKSLI